MTEHYKTLPEHELLIQKSLISNLNLWDWVFAVLVFAATVFVQTRSGMHMDIYETVMLWASAGIAVFLGWFFKPMRWFVPLSVLLAYAAVGLYGGNIKSAEIFLLRYFLSSQSAIMWQCAFVFFALFAYISGAVLASVKNVPTNTLLGMGTVFAWVSAVAGFTGLLVRWHESYLLRPDAGHIPVSNLYEVFILFLVITALMYLYYESKFAVQKLGGFVFGFMAVVVGFVLWYSVSREAHTIQPLIPALQSWWMKIHVPANFIGYGAFCISAMLGIAELVSLRAEGKGGKLWLPPSALIDEVMYKAIAVGFLFFTIATILGALWAADAWGRYWSWDPKETWAFIVWLNYAVWLHLRLVAGWRGKVLAWWAIIGLFVTAFAFIGVNMFLSGLHSYGTL
ncbi:TPA: c-type cytochrome biogenesis protein CcsB [Neisseria meningitidis]|uniref:c-type cytochrome biogenesis protein CcsB n=1 Tax=Neisseria TaxID=482 RepID=UPI00027C8F4D|nr:MULTISPECIES: c-type cytochrome biogenesis protein CcsB [Neisseria]EJU77190.1 cytochrome c-type biogenesis protein CcsB [Neisseria meningitidis NM3001]MBW3882118.1 c-type cytochrome biogenesis protein CcsB [Neisseria meningitidis]MBW3932436.1 c-type cytochrome biogenesis protein CcsB [Neisseria meningitidis]MCL4977841.1 c-type cytochrome biogenesis protein CcsB [Neisseria meningitidis]MCL4990389.1 c-type cytochrome biogenesis protein CcsB [Neisseria meningitidis]